MSHVAFIDFLNGFWIIAVRLMSEWLTDWLTEPVGESERPHLGNKRRIRHCESKCVTFESASSKRARLFVTVAQLFETVVTHQKRSDTQVLFDRSEFYLFFLVFIYFICFIRSVSFFQKEIVKWNICAIIWIKYFLSTSPGKFENFIFWAFENVLLKKKIMLNVNDFVANYFSFWSVYTYQKFIVKFIIY